MDDILMQTILESLEDTDRMEVEELVESGMTVYEALIELQLI